MSLSFVSSAVLSSTDGVSHNEEVAVESVEVEQLRLHNGASRPLFEQLRSNREDEQDKYDAFDKATRTGMRPLDEEDCAHLDSVASQKRHKDRVRRTQEEDELALFRAARAERSFERAELVVPECDDAGSQRRRDDDAAATAAPTVPVITRTVPTIVGKRKRRKPTPASSGDGRAPPGTADAHKTNTTRRAQGPTNVTSSSSKETQESTTKAEVASDDDDTDVLGGLLGGYGSDSD